MHLILSPLLTLPKPLVERRATGSPAVDLSPWNGAASVADDAMWPSRREPCVLYCLLLGCDDSCEFV